jgi:HAE1 family hydrophobic/amphiphilic exporter-1
VTLPEFSVRQTVLVNVLFFVCLLGGWAAYSRIPLEFFQDVNLNEAIVTTIWPGASAEEVERLVTQKLEEELLSVTDIDQVRSVSSAGSSVINVEFDEFLDEVQYEAALNDLRAALDRVTDLPADAETPVVSEGKFSEFAPVVMIAVVDTGDVGPLALREVARDVKSRLRDLPGANRIEVRGEQEREIRVEVDQDVAARFGLTVPDVVSRIRRQNLNLPAGTFETPDGEQTLRARGDYQSVQDILETVVAENSDGTIVRLAEVADVREALEKARFINRYDGRPALFVTITKKSSADVVDLVDQVDAWLADYRSRLPEGVALAKTFDTARFVTGRMGILVDNLVTGIAFVVLLLWFTIGFRNAALTAIAIPFSFLTAMIFFPVFDVTLNATTITGMLLVSGMLVDDAIIVLENVYARIERGESLRTAVVGGAEEVLWPVVAAVTTTCAAFLPLLLVGGTAGKFLGILPKAVVLCLLASLFECLIILPAHYMDFGSRRAAGDQPPGRLARFRERVDAGLGALRDGYVRALDGVLAHRGAFGALFVAICILAYGGAQHLRVDLFPGEFDTFNVLLEMPSDSSLTETDRVVRGYESIVADTLGVTTKDFATTVGMSVDINYDRLTGSHHAMTVLTLLPTEENIRDPDRALFRMQEEMEAFAERWPGRIGELRVQAEQDGPPLGPPVEMRLQGDDYELGKAVAGEVTAFLRTIPGVYNVEDDLKIGAPEVRLLVDHQRAAQHGLGFVDLATALRAANDGLVASSFRDPQRNEDMDIRVLLAHPDRESLLDLLDVDVATPAGYLVKLRDVADVEVARGYRAYHRYDGKRTVSVLAQVDNVEATSLSANQALQARFADLEDRYPQLEIRFGGEFEESGEAFADLGRAFPVALVAIYMILAALFRSYAQPLVVITAVPFAFVGIVLGVTLLDYNVSFVLLYAAIGLTGVVVNDSLVMVDFINRARRDEGLPLVEAVRQSGARRFRPILLTTLTTVVALMPMALGLQGASKTYGPFAASITFGLMVATIGTLFVVPLTYTSLLAWQARIGRRWRKWRGRGPGAGTVRPGESRAA